MGRTIGIGRHVDAKPDMEPVYATSAGRIKNIKEFLMEWRGTARELNTL